MKVELLIADDKELRASINELIRGQVLNVARQEITNIVAGVVAERLPNKTANDVINQLYGEEIRKQVAAALNEGKGYSSPSFVQRVVRDEVREQLKNLIKDGNAI